MGDRSGHDPARRHGGRRRSVNVREVLNGIFYVLWTGCQWKALPKDLPPKTKVHDYLELWNWDGTLERIHHALYVPVREEEGCEAARRWRSSTRSPRALKTGHIHCCRTDAGAGRPAARISYQAPRRRLRARGDRARIVGLELTANRAPLRRGRLISTAPRSHSCPASAGLFLYRLPISVTGITAL